MLALRLARSPLASSASLTSFSRIPAASARLIPLGARGMAADAKASAPAPSKDEKKDATTTTSTHFAFSPVEHPLVQELGLQRPSAKHLITSPAYTDAEINSVKETHVEIDTFRKKIAHRIVRFLRWSFDRATNYDPKNMTEDKYLDRFVFLETIAAVPGMVGGMLRHLHSLVRHVCFTLEYDGVFVCYHWSLACFVCSIIASSLYCH